MRKLNWCGWVPAVLAACSLAHAEEIGIGVLNGTAATEAAFRQAEPEPWRRKEKQEFPQARGECRHDRFHLENCGGSVHGSLLRHQSGLLRQQRHFCVGQEP